MFNAEKLLGQVIGGVLGKGGGKGRKNLLGGLKSGTGLMTAIGLAVGAYEILKDKQSAAMAGPVGPAGPVTPPPPPAWRKPGSTPAMPPVPPPLPSQPAAAVPAAAPAVAPPAVGELSDEDLARRMIQVMIAAACADGTMDGQEEQAILDKLREAGLSQEEKMFMLEELHHPRDIATLTSGSISPAAAKVMYMLAVTAIAVDTEVERAWLDELARGLGLSPAVRKFIEEQKEAV